MDKKTWIILGILAVVFCGLIGVSILQSTNRDQTEYNLATVIEANDASGGYGEMIAGDPDAPVKIYEYGDYQCTACAPMNPHINEIVEEYDGKVAVVFRTYIMSYHQNGTAAASAALAASKQGHWQEYKDALFTHQNDWYDSSPTQRQAQFEQYFAEVTKGKGNLEQFREDMGSDATAKKISFDSNLSRQANIEWTPSFFVDGELVDQHDMTTAEFLDKLRTKIDENLAAQGIKK